MNRKHLYVVAAVIWGIPGIIITSKGIGALPEKVKIWQTFPTRGWILLVFMMGLGIALKHIPGVPSAFTASFYTGLGPMLLLSAGRYLLKSGRNVTL